MATLPTDSYAATGVPLWLSATAPATLISPLTIVNSLTNPTDTMTISMPDTGIGSISVTDVSGTGAITIAPGNVNMAPNGVTATASFSTSNLFLGTGIVVDTPSNSQNFQISQDALGTTLEQGVGAKAKFNNDGSVDLVDDVKVSPSGVLAGTDATNTWELDPSTSSLTFSNVSGNAIFGQSGTSAFVGTGTAPTTVLPGLLVNDDNGANIKFSDGTNDAYLSMFGGNLELVTDIGSNNLAISVAQSGQVTIPDLLLSGGTLNVSNVNLTTINTYTSSQLISYYDCPGVAVATASLGWVKFFDISLNATQKNTPSLDFHMPNWQCTTSNVPNYEWTFQLGVGGDNFVAPLGFPPTSKGFQGITVNVGPPSPSDGYGSLTDCFCLRNGIDYDSNTVNMEVWVLGVTNNPILRTISNAKAIHVRAYPY
jgi:hypothetical protein